MYVMKVIQGFRENNVGQENGWHLNPVVVHEVLATPVIGQVIHDNIFLCR